MDHLHNMDVNQIRQKLQIVTNYFFSLLPVREIFKNQVHFAQSEECMVIRRQALL